MSDPYAGYRKHARALVTAEIEDILTRTDDGVPESQWAQAAGAVAALSRPDALSILVETAAIAGEAIIRLAAARGEDPRATWQWILTTPWTGSEHDPSTP